jgi:hypothetical protein
VTALARTIELQQEIDALYPVAEAGFWRSDKAWSPLETSGRCWVAGQKTSPWTTF